MIKSTFSILFIVRKSRLGKSGEAAITMRITVNGRFTEMNTLRKVPLSLWDQKKERAVGKGPAQIEINRLTVVVWIDGSVYNNNITLIQRCIYHRYTADTEEEGRSLMLYKQLDKIQLLAYILCRRRKSRLNISKQMTLTRLLRIYLMWYKFIHSGSKGTQNMPIKEWKQ